MKIYRCFYTKNIKYISIDTYKINVVQDLGHYIRLFVNDGAFMSFFSTSIGHYAVVGDTIAVNFYSLEDVERFISKINSTIGSKAEVNFT